jgi:hypothetical protein
MVAIAEENQDRYLLTTQMSGLHLKSRTILALAHLEHFCGRKSIGVTIGSSMNDDIRMSACRFNSYFVR